MESDITNRPMLTKKLADVIEAEYPMTAEDYVAWQLHAWEKSITLASRSLVSWIGSLIIGFVFCVLLFLFAGIAFLAVREVFLAPDSLKRDFVPIITGGTVLLILLVGLARGAGPKSFTRHLARRSLIHQLRRQAKQFPPRNMKAILTPDKVIEICFTDNGKQETVLDWTLLESIDLAGQHAFFLTKTNMVLIVPQRAFADEKTFLDFVETGWAFHRRAKEKSPPLRSDSYHLQVDGTEERISVRSDNRIVS